MTKLCLLLCPPLSHPGQYHGPQSGAVERQLLQLLLFLRRHSVVRDTALGGSEVGTEVGTALSPPVLFTFACPSVSTGSTSGCGCCGGGGGEEGRSLGGCSGSEAQTLGDGRERPCMRVLISLLLVVFLYHLTYETKMEALPEMLRRKVVIQWVIKSTNTHQCGLINGVQLEVS